MRLTRLSDGGGVILFPNRKQDCEMNRELWVDDPELADWRKPSCAVVGNSGRLRNEHHAAAIDAHDIVIRFNAGKTQNFEHIVGRRSTFRMFNGPYVGPKQGGEVTVAQVGRASRPAPSLLPALGLRATPPYIPSGYTTR